MPLILHYSNSRVGNFINRAASLDLKLKDQNRAQYILIFSLFYTINRGSHMSAYVLLNIFSMLGKRDKMRGLASILSLFHNEVNKFDNK